jgi:hypothetical protein
LDQVHCLADQWLIQEATAYCSIQSREAMREAFSLMPAIHSWHCFIALITAESGISLQRHFSALCAYVQEIRDEVKRILNSAKLQSYVLMLSSSRTAEMRELGSNCDGRKVCSEPCVSHPFPLYLQFRKFC